MRRNPWKLVAPSFQRMRGLQRYPRRNERNLAGMRVLCVSWKRDIPDSTRQTIDIHSAQLRVRYSYIFATYTTPLYAVTNFVLGYHQPACPSNLLSHEPPPLSALSTRDARRRPTIKTDRFTTLFYLFPSWRKFYVIRRRIAKGR